MFAALSARARARQNDDANPAWQSKAKSRKSARDDGRNDIRPGIHEGANPLWSKNGETPNPASAQPKPPEQQSKAQKEVKERTAAAAAAAQEESAARQKEAERIENESKQAAGCQP